MGKAAQGDSSLFGKGKDLVVFGERGGQLDGVLEPPKVLKPGPRGTGSCEGPRTRAGGPVEREQGVFLRGVLSPPIISHCPIES